MGRGPTTRESCASPDTRALALGRLRNSDPGKRHESFRWPAEELVLSPLCTMPLDAGAFLTPKTPTYRYSPLIIYTHPQMVRRALVTCFRNNH